MLGTVYCFCEWDPDGSGPQPSLLVIGGEFTQAGDVATTNLAFFEPITRTFSAPQTTTGSSDASPNGAVRALLAASSGELIVGGDFRNAGGVAGTVGIASYDGAGWRAIDGGVEGSVTALLEQPNGDLVAGGSFATTNAGSVTTNSIAQFDGVAWQPLAGGVTDPSGAGSVAGLALLDNGDLVAGGSFSTAGNTPAPSLARWDGATWTSFAGSLSGLVRVERLLQLQNGDLILIGFSFGSARVNRWDGTAWAAEPNAPPLSFVTELANGDLVGTEASSLFAANPPVWRLRAGAWTSMGTMVSNSFASAVAVASGHSQFAAGDFVIGGPFRGVDATDADGLCLYESGSWSNSGSAPFGPDAEVRAFASATDGTVYACGMFASIDGVPLQGVASWDGLAWAPVGGGIPTVAGDTIQAIAVAGNGDVYVGGFFTAANPLAITGVARWDGTAWSNVPGVVSVKNMTTLQNGDVVAAGFALHAIRDGTAQLIPDAQSLEGVVQLPDGRLAATGALQDWGAQTTSRSAIWNGTSWSQMAHSHSLPRAIGLAPNGDPTVSASFFNGDAVRSWDGTAWNTIVPGTADAATRSVIRTPGGDLVLGTIPVPGPSPLRGIARAAAGGSLTPIPGVGETTAMHLDLHGTLFVASRGGNPQIHRFGTSCPASAVAIASGCIGPSPTLRAFRRAYVGGTYRSLTLDLPQNGLAINAYGFATANTQLGSLSPLAQAGCIVRITPDVPLLETIDSGIVTSSFELPMQPTLIGAQFYQQMVPFTFDANGSVTGLSASNALELTVGSF
ncbi:MAG: hypothetical protein AB8H80_06815 [Planctomycetota bacterium]